MSKQVIFEELKSIFNEDEIESLKNTPRKDRNHPVKRLLFPQDTYHRDAQVIFNTNKALKNLSLKEQNQWILNLKPRLLNLDDYSTSSSTLGEIRAFGSLLQAGVAVEQIASSGSDFWITEERSGEKVLLEVHSKQMNKNEAEDLEKFNQATNDRQFNSSNNSGWIIREHATAPFGKPSPTENVSENAISKIASIKQKEHQFSEKYTSILWLDFQDESWNLLENIEYFLPVFTWNGAFNSGVFWYAFYGWKDAPILEHFYLDIYNQVVKMRHDGRFLTSKKLDAVIVSFSRATVIMENPYSQKPIQPWLWQKLLYLPWFKIEYSYTNWFSNDLEERIKLEKEKLVKLSEISSF